jgi:CheY-like chemotaxis protein
MLELTKSLLLSFGTGHVVTAKNGEEGYRKFCETNPDIVIADWMMQPMDGISFTRLVRNDPRSPNPYVPVILMTGFSEKRRVVQARDAGVTEFLVKPFTARDMYRRISQIVERPREFVKSEDFFGPDRRRTKRSDYEGPLRREEDASVPEMASRRRETVNTETDNIPEKTEREKEERNPPEENDLEDLIGYGPDDIDMV